MDLITLTWLTAMTRTMMMMMSKAVRDPGCDRMSEATKRLRGTEANTTCVEKGVDEARGAISLDNGENKEKSAKRDRGLDKNSH